MKTTTMTTITVISNNKIRLTRRMDGEQKDSTERRIENKNMPFVVVVVFLFRLVFPKILL